MFRLPIRLVILYCSCVLVRLSRSEQFPADSDSAQVNYFLSQKNLQDELNDQDYAKSNTDDSAKFAPAEGTSEDETNLNAIPDREIRSPKSLWSRILNRIGKTSETFMTSRNYPLSGGRMSYSRRFYAPASFMSKFKRSEEKPEEKRSGSVPSFAEERAMNDGKFQSPQKKGGKLSINGALSSLADMLLAESHRRDQAAAMDLRQRLLVAGRR